jgi:hypothetical protein
MKFYDWRYSGNVNDSYNVVVRVVAPVLRDG